MKYFYLFLLSFCIFFGLNSVAQRPSLSDTFMILGKKSFDSKDYRLAKPLLDSCIALNTKNDVCLYCRGVIAFDEKEFELSKNLFKGVLSSLEKDYAAWNYLGLCFQELKQFDSAEFCIKNAIRLNSKESKFYANWAKNEYLRGNLEHADQLYQTATFLDPTYVNHYKGHAVVLSKMGKKDQVETMYQQAIASNPNNEELKEAYQSIAPKSSFFSSWMIFAGLFLLLFSYLIYRKKAKSL